MDKATLDQTHPTYDAGRWSELDALAKGGKRFHALIETFLPQNPMEPGLRYNVRKKRARFYSYTGAIINLYVSWLFAAGFEAKPYDRGSDEPIPSPDSWYGSFQEDVGGETTLKAFFKQRFCEAMTVGKSVWLAELPTAPDGYDPGAASRADYEKLGLGSATLTKIDPADLLDWEETDNGELEWCVVKSCWCERPSPLAMRSQVVEQWRIYDRETVTTWELRYDKANPPTEAEKIPKNKGTTTHGFKRVPVMRLALAEEMCIGEQTYDAQVAHFQLDNALSWAIAATCYPVPVWKLADADKQPTLGIGYAVFIGQDEDLTWSSPPADAYETIAKNRDAKREEIFRIVHQMASGVDNNAETVGRSAESKEIDAAATRIMLNAYGELVGKAIEETYELISEAREDDYEWSVEGFTGYDTATAGSLLANVEMAKTLGIPSETFQREISKKAALALIPELDPRVKDRVRAEIDQYKFQVTGEVLEQTLQQDMLDSTERTAKASIKSQEKVSKDSLKSKEKTAAMSAKAKASAPKPKTRAG